MRVTWGPEHLFCMGEAFDLFPTTTKTKGKERQSALATLNRAQPGDAVGEKGTGLSSTFCLISECCHSICNLLNTLVSCQAYLVLKALAW